MAKHMEKPRSVQVYISLKCGINTGYATIYNLGNKKSRAQLLPAVNTVNIASSLVDISDTNLIIVSAATRSKIVNQFKIRRAGSAAAVELKIISGSFEI